jgi:heavy metal sensor kinase
MSGRPQFVSLDDEVRCIVAPIDHRYVFVSTQSMAAEEQTLTRVRSAFALAIPTVLILAAVGGYLLTRRTLGPIARITETASRIEAENLSERIAVGHEDELGRLAAVLNALLDRLERSFHQQKQLLADTSHELRTPVTIIRSEAEVTLSRERSADEYRNALESIRSESVHLTNLIEGVLMLARADARQMHIAKRQFSLREVVEQAVQTARTLARARGVDLSAVTDGAMPLRGEAELIRRMLLNLLDNAVKFTEPGGRVSVDAQQDGANYTITVTDSGCGIAAEDQEQIFDRFFRGDRARRRDLDGAPGTGLGLSIVKWIAEAHGGTVRLVRSNAAGSTFEVALPAIAADA